jgi:hypothetical protein
LKDQLSPAGPGLLFRIFYHFHGDSPFDNGSKGFLSEGHKMPAFGSPKAGTERYLISVLTRAFRILLHSGTAAAAWEVSLAESVIRSLSHYFSSAKYLMVRTIWLV